MGASSPVAFLLNKDASVNAETLNVVQLIGGTAGGRRRINTFKPVNKVRVF